MSDIGNKLKHRIGYSMMALSTVPHDNLWRFGAKKPLKKESDIYCSDLRDGGATLDFRRKGQWESLCHVTNLRPDPSRIRDRKETDIPVGSPKTVDKLVLPMTNYDGVIASPVEYDARLSRLRTREHAFALNFGQSFEQTFGLKVTVGGEAYGGSAEAWGETKFGVTASQETTDTEGEQEGEDRGAGISPECPPGYDITFNLNRTAQPMKTNVKCIGEVDFGLKCGKYDDGWKGRKGKGGEYYPRWGQWDSFWEEFIPVIKGEGRRDLCFAKHFWDNPAPDWLIEKITRPLDLPFDHTGDVFDGATVLRVNQTVNRGPKYESQRLVIEDELVG